LFFGLLLDFIALPFPGELVMGYTGYLIYQGQLNLSAAISVAWLGTSIGMTITYFIGRRLGYPFLVRYGPRLFLGPKKLKKATDSFEKYGSRLLFFAFFIPGVRHFTGYLAGILNIPFRTFALYTYSGALFWVVVFIVGGRILGPKWELIHDLASRYGIEILMYIVAIIVLCLLYGKNSGHLDNRVLRMKDSQFLLRLKLILIGGLFSSTIIYMVSTAWKVKGS
jgi:membrane protein DedA with SNARE-associated domain